MTDRIKRQERIDKMSKIDKTLENMETLNDLYILYRKSIKSYLNEITTDNTLQAQIKFAMNIK